MVGVVSAAVPGRQDGLGVACAACSRCSIRQPWQTGKGWCWMHNRHPGVLPWYLTVRKPLRHLCQGVSLSSHCCIPLCIQQYILNPQAA
jgi:hypothetical protein